MALTPSDRVRSVPATTLEPRGPMATGDLLRRLLSAHVRNDDEAFRATAFELVREERAKRHSLLAEDLERLLRTRGLDTTKVPIPMGAQGRVEGPLPQPPRDRDRGLNLLRVSQPELTWGRLVLPERQLSRLSRVVDEHKRAELLASAGLAPTRRLLFHGPPGSGKTLAAQVIASALDYPLATVRFDGIVSSFLGETSANLARVFEYIEQRRMVVLFDEFDAIAKERGDLAEHGELKRVVNALLQQMDAYTGASVIIAATNHESLLDSAIWRRFEMVVRFPLPERQDRVLMLGAFLRAHRIDDQAIEWLADKTAGASGSDLELITINAARAATLSLDTGISRRHLVKALEEYQERSQNHATGSRAASKQT